MLTVDGVDLFYGASHILRRVGLTAEPGQVTCLLGRNGVGKTSLLRAVLGLEPIRRGRILWQGEDIARLPPHARARRRIGYVPQGRDIFPRLTVRENLETGFAALPRAERFIPDEVFELFPVLREMPGRRGGDLSGGQQQQLAIGRALVMRPRLLILDEPTEGIQPSIIKHIETVIRRLADGTAKGDGAVGGMAILLVEQYFDFARGLADRWAVMDRGEIVLTGTRDDMHEEEVRRHLTV